MKLTKTDKVRSFVTKKDKKERGDLYQVPKIPGQKKIVLEDQMVKRIQDASEFYSAFYRVDDEEENAEEEKIENYFSLLLKATMKSMQLRYWDKIAQWQEITAEEKDKIIENRIQWMMKCESLRENNEGEVRLAEISAPQLSDDEFNEIFKRMKGILRRADKGETAVLLMQGLAQKNGDTLSTVIKKIEMNNIQHENLKKFIDAVIRDYYHVNALESIRRIDVRVQSQRQENNSLLQIASGGKPQKAALNETLLKYSASEAESNKVLKDIKNWLCQYFSVEGLQSDDIWGMPRFSEESEDFFDVNFKEETNAKEKGSRVAGNSLKKLWNEKDPDFSAIKARIKYVNYGKYLHFIKKENISEFEKYWVKFIKDYIEETYTGKRKISRAECTKTKMFSSCWWEIIRYLCGKYIDIGKAVYHFAMPANLVQEGEVSYGGLRDEFSTGISSFDYEMIKAEETLQRDISVVATAAISTFSSSIVDEDKRSEDLMMIDDPDKLWGLVKQYKIEPDDPESTEEPPKTFDVKHYPTVQLLRFFGGASNVKGIDWHAENADRDFVWEIKSHLTLIRNENFHYLSEKKSPKSTHFTELLWKNDQNAYSDMVKQKYYSNNAGMFYKENDLSELVKYLYNPENKDKIAESQIPAFKKVWPRSTFNKEIETAISEKRIHFKADVNNANKRSLFEQALYFILKDIYYRDFILSLNEDVKYLFFDEAEEYYNNYKDDKDNGYAVENFNEFIGNLSDSSNIKTFGNICQAITQEYDRQNSKKGEEEKYKHYKKLFPIYVKNTFLKYINEQERYQFLRTAYDIKQSEEELFLKDLYIESMDFPVSDQRNAAWFTFAHMIHPRQLNLLIGDFKSYIQYRQDILNRMDCANEFQGPGRYEDKARQENDFREKKKQAQSVLQVLEFVRMNAGRVSNYFKDYYEDENEYADYLHQYIDFEKLETETSFDSFRIFCQNTLPDGAAIDLYTDDRNPKVLRNIELARMYSGGDLSLKGRDPVTKEEICNYYANKPKVEDILTQSYEDEGLCKNADDQEMVVNEQRAKNRITLNDITDIYAIINDLLGQLTSLAYLRERDQMYLLLGFYYMALQQNPSGWGEEKLQSAELAAKHATRDSQNDAPQCNIFQGAVLYQIVSIYNYDLPMPKYGINAGWRWVSLSGAYAGKKGDFMDSHKESYPCASRLFEKNEITSKDLRNYIDHGEYFYHPTYSIVDLYNNYYKSFFKYSRSLRNAVAYDFTDILKKYHVETRLIYRYDDNKKFGFVLPKELNSTMFTYNLKEGKQYQKEARDEKFLQELKEVLEYKKEDSNESS